MCAGGIFPAICFIEKNPACFIVKGVLELGLPSSSLPLSVFLTFPVSLYFFLSLSQAFRPPPFFFLSLRLKMMFAAYGVLIVYYQSGSHIDNYM